MDSAVAHLYIAFVTTCANKYKIFLMQYKGSKQCLQFWRTQCMNAGSERGLLFDLSKNASKTANSAILRLLTHAGLLCWLVFTLENTYLSFESTYFARDRGAGAASPPTGKTLLPFALRSTAKSVSSVSHRGGLCPRLDALDMSPKSLTFSYKKSVGLMTNSRVFPSPLRLLSGERLKRSDNDCSEFSTVIG